MNPRTGLPEITREIQSEQVWSVQAKSPETGFRLSQGNFRSSQSNNNYQQQQWQHLLGACCMPDAVQNYLHRIFLEIFTAVLWDLFCFLSCDYSRWGRWRPDDWSGVSKGQWQRRDLNQKSWFPWKWTLTQISECQQFTWEVVPGSTAGNGGWDEGQ